MNDRTADFRDWMENFFLPTIETTQAPERVWCSQWWEHPEAVDRLCSLWVAHVAVLKDPPALSDWWVRHFDPHMDRLTSHHGVFADCRGRHGPVKLMNKDALPPQDWEVPFIYQIQQEPEDAE